MHLYDQLLIFETYNIASRENAHKYESFVKLLQERDPMELYIEQLEKSALEESDASHIGLFTMINDYQARLGWQFAPIAGSEDLVSVKIMVHLEVEI